MNSLTVLLGFLTLAALGYFSFVRLMFKHEMSQEQGGKLSLRAAFTRAGTLGSLAQTWIFIGLPGVAIMLFWGWGPALLWVTIAHLLLETPANFIAVKMHGQVNIAAHFSDYDSFKSGLRASLFQILLLALMTLLVVLLARLIDEQTGLLFAIVCVVGAMTLLRSADGALDAVAKLVGAIALLVLGLLLAKSIGIAVFGELVLAPAYAPWLKINNQTLLMLLLLYSCSQLVGSQSLRSGLNALTGALVLLLFLVIIVHLGLLQPELDAPLLSPSLDAESQPPVFASLFLLVSPVLLSVLMQIVVTPTHHDDDQTPVTQEFLSRQLVSVFGFLISLSVLVALATASGIGAWNTHYTFWESSASLDAMFSLIKSSLVSLSGFAEMGDQSLLTLLTVTLCLFGIACLIFCTRLLHRQSRMANAEANEENSLWAKFAATLGPQYLLVFVAGAWFLSNDLGIELWIWVLSIAWILSSDVLCDYARDMETASFGDHFRRGFALVIFFVGASQLAWTAINQLIDGHHIGAGLLLLNLGIGGFMCSANALQCWQGLRLRDESKLFEG